MSEADYPYEEKTHRNRCNYDAAKSVAECSDSSSSRLRTRPSSVGRSRKTSDPTAVGMDASHYDFQLYESGIYSNANCGKEINELDHGVLAVGYGTDSDGDFWLARTVGQQLGPGRLLLDGQER